MSLKIVLSDTKKSGHFVSQITNEQIKLRDSVTNFRETGLECDLIRCIMR